MSASICVRSLSWAGIIFLSGCATTVPDVKRLNPVPVESKAPSECRLISVMSGSPADKAGLKVGDHITKINKTLLADAWQAGEMVNDSGDVMEVEVVDAEVSTKTIQIPLLKTKPRLGAACDLTGFRKHGVTAAGNESQTIFQGPFALTASGIVDKGVVFVRLRFTNNTDHEIFVGPGFFSAISSSSQTLNFLTPKEVICEMFGDRGARQLSLKKRKQESADYQGENSREDACGAVPIPGKLKNAEMGYVESNAEYLARESLWPTSVKPGGTADGVVYWHEAGVTFPVTIKTEIEGRQLEVALGTTVFVPHMETAKISEIAQTPAELESFFKSQKKNAPLRVILKKDKKVFVGRFSSYDEVDEVVWFNTPTGWILNSTSIPLRSLLSAQSVDAAN